MAAEQPLERMFYLKEIVGIECRSQPLVAFVIRDGIQPFGREVFGKILAVDDLAHQEKVFPLSPHGAAQKLKEPFGEQVCHVQPQAVDAELVYPELHGAADIVRYRGAGEVELYKLHMSFPALVPETVAVRAVSVEIDMEPILLIAPFAEGAHLFEGEKTPADVIEHAVEHDADTRFMKFLHEPSEVGVVAEPSVDIEEIDGVIAVPFALEKRVEEHRPEPHLFHVRYIFLDRRKAVTDLSEVVFPFGTAISERIDLIKGALVEPHKAKPSCR